MAEAYLNSKQIKGLEVSSSGIEASNALDGPITWQAQRIIKNNNLIPFESSTWHQTVKESLDGMDLIVFMQKMQYDWCVDGLGFEGKNFEIWDIEDLKNSLEQDSIAIPETEEIYKKITDKIDGLIQRVKLI